MVAVAKYHDTTSKTLLNGTVLSAGGTAQADLTGALTNIFNDSNVGPFVCTQLIQHPRDQHAECCLHLAYLSGLRQQRRWRSRRL